MQYTLGNTVRPRLYDRPLVATQPGTWPAPPIGPLCIEHEGEWTVCPDGQIEQLAILPASYDDWLGFKATWDIGQINLTSISVEVTTPSPDPAIIAGIALALENPSHFMELEIYCSGASTFFGLYRTRWPEETEFVTCFQELIPPLSPATTYKLQAAINGQKFTCKLLLGSAEIKSVIYTGGRTTGTRFGFYDAKNAPSRIGIARFNNLDITI